MIYSTCNCTLAITNPKACNMCSNNRHKVVSESDWIYYIKNRYIEVGPTTTSLTYLIKV